MRHLLGALILPLAGLAVAAPAQAAGCITRDDFQSVVVRDLAKGNVGWTRQHVLDVFGTPSTAETFPDQKVDNWFRGRSCNGEDAYKVEYNGVFSGPGVGTVWHVDIKCRFGLLSSVCINRTNN